MDYDFTGKVAIISGAASGMGLLSAKTFASYGANVVMTDIDEAKVQQCAAEVTAAGAGKAIGVKCDVRSYKEVEAAVTAGVEAFGRIDIVVNTAGGAETRMLKVDTKGKDFCDLPIDIYDWSLDVNLKGQLYFDHAAAKYMRAQKSGVFINIGSITGEEGSANNIGYSTSKSAAMNGMTKSLAQFGAPYGVRAVCVAPGPVLTRPGMANMKTALGRAAEPQELVDLIVYLASDKAAFITGITILADGGRNIMFNKG